jgi:hypothetical protein
VNNFNPFDAWLAGFLDGEGTIVTTTANGRPFVYVVITQHERSRAVLEEIQAVYGGFISRHTSLGSYMPPGGISNCLRWDLKSRFRVEILLRNLLPHLRIKRAKAEQALAAIVEADAAVGAKRRWREADLAVLRETGPCTYAEARALMPRLNRSADAILARSRRFHQ